MLQQLKFTLKHTFIYSLGNVVVKLVGFILLPIYTSKLTTAQYGILAILEATFNILTPLVFLNINMALTRFYNERKADYDKGELLFTALIFTIISGLLTNILFQPLSDDLSKLIFQTTEFTIYFRLVFLNLALQSILFLIRGYYNAVQKPGIYALLNFTRFLLVLGLTIYFLVKLEMGITGILLAQTISILLSIIFYAYDYLKRMKSVFRFDLLKAMLKYSTPLAFAAISGLILSFGDRYVLKFLLGEAVVGIYSLATKMVNVLDFLVINSFQLAYFPFAFKNYHKSNFIYWHSKFTTYLMFIVTFLGLVIALYAKGVVMIFSPSNRDFWEAAKYVPFLVFIKPIYILRYMFRLSFDFSKKTKIIPIAVTVSAILNIGLNIVFIKFFGVYGVILSTFLINVFVAVLYYVLGQREFRLEYEFGRLAHLYILAIMVVLIAEHIAYKNVYVAIVVKFFILLGYLAALFITGFFKKEEIDAMKGFIKKWGNVKQFRQNLKDIVR